MPQQTDMSQVEYLKELAKEAVLEVRYAEIDLDELDRFIKSWLSSYLKDHPIPEPQLKVDKLIEVERKHQKITLSEHQFHLVWTESVGRIGYSKEMFQEVLGALKSKGLIIDPIPEPHKPMEWVTDENGLLPCPFCGEYPIIKHKWYKSGVRDVKFAGLFNQLGRSENVTIWFVMCENSDCKMHPSTTYQVDKETAINTWNYRLKSRNGGIDWEELGKKFNNEMIMAQNPINHEWYISMDLDDIFNWLKQSIEQKQGE